MRARLIFLGRTTHYHVSWSLSSILNAKGKNVDNCTETQLKGAIRTFIPYKKKWDLSKNSQAIKTGTALKSLGEKQVVKSRVVAKKWPKLITLNVYGHFLAATFDFTAFFLQTFKGRTSFYSLAVLTWIILITKQALDTYIPFNI